MSQKPTPTERCPSPSPEYLQNDLSAPILSGISLKLFANFIEYPVLGYYLRQRILKTSGFTAFRERAHLDMSDVQPVEYPLFLPQPPLPRRDPRIEDVNNLFFKLNPKLTDVTSRPMIRHYYNAYKSKRFTPIEVIQKLLGSIVESNSPPHKLNAVIRVQRSTVLTEAVESTERWDSGNPISVLDGVPFTVKDMIDVKGYPTSASSGFLENEDKPRTEDAESVAALRKLGMIMVGKCNQDELGIGVKGFSMFSGQAFNPHDKNYTPGGSSGGSGIAVAAGLCPVSIASDAGGSVRIPSLCNGIYGIKATFGRISSHGRVLTDRTEDENISPCTHVGPIAGCVQDLILIYHVLSAFGTTRTFPGCELFRHTPQLPPSSVHARVKGLRVGVYKPWLKSASREGIDAVHTFIDELQKAGAIIVPVTIPNLEDIRVSLPVTLMTQCIERLRRAGAYGESKGHGIGFDARGKLAMGREFAEADILRAKVVRAKAMAHASEMFRRVDIVVTPGLGCDVPLLSRNLSTGEVDVGTESKMMKYTVYGNVVGVPCSVVPVGRTGKGVPIGIQMIAGPWREDVLLRTSLWWQRIVGEIQCSTSWNVLKEESAS